VKIPRQEDGNVQQLQPSFFIALRNPSLQTASHSQSSSKHASATFFLLFFSFLPRDATLARYLLSSCVRPSVRHKPVLYRNDWTNRAGFGMEASFHLSHTGFCGNFNISKIMALSSATLPQTQDLENFTTASQNISLMV